MKLQPKQVRALLARKGLPRLIGMKARKWAKNANPHFGPGLGDATVERVGEWLNYSPTRWAIQGAYERAGQAVRTAKKHAGRVYGQAVYQGKLKTKYVAEYAYNRAKNDPVGAAAVGGSLLGGVAGYSNYGLEPQYQKHGVKRAARTVGGAIVGAWLGGAGMTLRKRGKGSLR
jgi:hypothetical protein